MEKKRKNNRVRTVVKKYREGSDLSDMLFKLAQLVLGADSVKGCDGNAAKRGLR